MRPLGQLEKSGLRLRSAFTNRPVFSSAAILVLMWLGLSATAVSQAGIDPADETAKPSSSRRNPSDADNDSTIPVIRNRDFDPDLVDKSAKQNSRRRDSNDGVISDQQQAVANSIRDRTTREPLTEFQRAVSETLGERLPIFGRELFSQVPSTFAPLDRVPVSGNYVIGPGDVLVIHAWGRIDVDYSATVDRSGNISVPRVGTISVAGVQYKDLKDHLRSAFGLIYKNFELSVSISQLRSIQVFVVGQARRPGTYTVSSLSSLVNALFASGGPAANGSMRRIQLKRDSVVVTQFDVYDFLLNGDKSKDVQLLQGDVIYIPPAGPLFAVAGSVKSPAIYELKDETTLGQATEFAGGFSEFADGDVATIERVEGHRARIVITVPLDATGFRQTIVGGDVIRLRQISPRFENAITLRGNVAWPGRYPWRTGMRLSDLITSKESLVTPDYWRKQNELVAITTPNQLDEFRSLEPDKDRAHTLTISNDLALNPRGKIGSGSHVSTEQLKTEVRRSGAEINWDYAVIQRLQANDLSTRLLPFNLGKAVAGDPNENLILEAGDVITVFSQADLSVPVGRRSKFVRLEGEFVAAGVYKVEPGESLRQVIERAGGLTPDAYIFGAEFNREATKEQQKKSLERYIADLQQEVDRSIAKQASAAQGSSADAATALQAQMRMIDRLRNVEPNGRIVLRMKSNADLQDIPDMPLEDGDRFYVPSRSKTVLVAGSVYQDGAQLYDKSLRVRDYLRYAGGPNRNADNSKIFVLRADGSVINKDQSGKFFGGSFGELKVMPGDTVVVPQAVDKGRFLRELKDWTQIISQFGISAAAIRVLSN
jgi:polysaccharide biosynthesis/export protein